jgi:hypothetical protein
LSNITQRHIFAFDTHAVRFVVWIVIVIWFSHEYFGRLTVTGEGIRSRSERSPGGRGAKPHMVISFLALDGLRSAYRFLTRSQPSPSKLFTGLVTRLMHTTSRISFSAARCVVLDRQTNFHEFYISPDRLGGTCVWRVESENRKCVYTSKTSKN